MSRLKLLKLAALLSVFAASCYGHADEYALVKSVAYPTKCLHIQSDSIVNFASLDLAPCDPNSNFQLVNVKSWPTVVLFKIGKCLTGPDDGNVANGVHALSFECGGLGWQIYKMDGAQLQGANGKCLTAQWYGAYIAQWDCLNQPHQQWTLDRLEWKVLKNNGFPGQCLHIKDDNGNNGAELDLAPCDGSSETQAVWANVDNGDGSEIHFKSGKCVTGPNDGDKANDVRAITWDCADKGWQKYKLVGAQLQGANGQCLTAQDGGSYLAQWDCVSYPQQQWSLEPAGF